MYVSRSSAAFSRFELILPLGRFAKSLIVKPNDVQDAMAKLERLSTLEGQMAVADILATVKHMTLDLTAMRRKSLSRRLYLSR